MAGFSVFYISAAVLLFSLQLGDASLVYANILNLSVRIIYSAHFITSFYASHGARHVIDWRQVLPRWPLFLSTASSVVIIKIIGIKLGITNGGDLSLARMPVLIYLGVGASMASISLLAWWMSSGRYLSVPRRVKAE